MTSQQRGWRAPYRVRQRSFFIPRRDADGFIRRSSVKPAPPPWDNIVNAARRSSRRFLRHSGKSVLDVPPSIGSYSTSYASADERLLCTGILNASRYACSRMPRIYAAVSASGKRSSRHGVSRTESPEADKHIERLWEIWRWRVERCFSHTRTKNLRISRRTAKCGTYIQKKMDARARHGVADSAILH